MEKATPEGEPACAVWPRSLGSTRRLDESKTLCGGALFIGPEMRALRGERGVCHLALPCAWSSSSISQFARVVKGVDLRSTGGNSVWVQTPQLTSALSCEQTVQTGPQALNRTRRSTDWGLWGGTECQAVCGRTLEVNGRARFFPFPVQSKRWEICPGRSARRVVSTTTCWSCEA